MMMHSSHVREQPSAIAGKRPAAWSILGLLMLLASAPLAVAQIPAISRPVRAGVWPLNLRSADSETCLVVCPPIFRDALRPWIQEREEGGLMVTLIESQPTAELLQRSIQSAADAHVRYVMLVGDAPAVGQPCDASLQVPALYLPTTIAAQWGSTPDAPSDGLYGDLNGDGSVDAAVGRLPVDQPETLAALVTRIMDYEHSENFGAWRGEVQLTGGVGGFGPLADAAIESVTRTLVTSVLPTETKTTVAYGSPGHLFFPQGRSFTEEVLARYERGSRFWVYAGHGWVDTLDRVPQTPLGEAVLDMNSVGRLSQPAGVAPVAVLLACFTGAFDAPQDCLAERMLLERAGPVAVFAGSRVTMPYGNTVTALGLIDGVYSEQPARLGQAWLGTLQALQRADDSEKSSVRLLVDSLASLVSPTGATLADERREHAVTYNLLGDPTLSLHHPQTVTLSAPSGSAPGERIVIDTESPIDGTLHLSLDRPLGSVTEGDPNQTTVASIQADVVADQPGQHSILLPPNVRGPLIIRATVEGTDGWATAATRTLVH